MLLRRITQHVKEQNWFAVLLDFVIVVVGILIALQITNWNDANKRQNEEKDLLLRLHAEASELLATQTRERDSVIPRLEILSSATSILFACDHSRDLTPQECLAVGGSHANQQPTDEMPTLDEIISSGRFELISNHDVRSHLRNYAITQDRGRRREAGNSYELYRLYSRHPEVIWITRAPHSENEDVSRWRLTAGEGYKWTIHCDTEKMRASNGFLSEYADNLARINSWVSRAEERIEVLTVIERVLAVETGANR